MLSLAYSKASHHWYGLHHHGGGSVPPQWLVLDHEQRMFRGVGHVLGEGGSIKGPVHVLFTLLSLAILQTLLPLLFMPSTLLAPLDASPLC